MNGVSNQDKRKDSLIKTLAIIGFMATIVVAVWLAVQVVQLAPSAFTSLASLAESVHGTPSAAEQFSVSTTKTVINDSDSVELNWNEAGSEGTYRFSYECTEGVAVAVTDNSGTTDVVCGQTYTLVGDGPAMLFVTSAAQRFIDVPYSLTFTEEGALEVSASDANRITVVNAAIPLTGIVAGTSDEENDATKPETTEPEREPNPETPTTPVTPITPAQPQYTFTYALPESDPNGFTDLEMKYLGVGEIKNNTFIPRGEIDNDTEGAVRFQVKNIGTKTSQRWTYEVLLPNGSTYSSDRQTALKPNETATIVLGVTATETGVQPIEGTVDVDDDRSTRNNSFSWSVRVTN